MAGLAAAFGSGAMTNTIGDIAQADVILITGSNTTENHPVIASVVKRAVHLKGKTLIVVDPRRIKMSDVCPHLAQAPSGHRRGLDQRHAARDHRREPARERIRGKPHRGLRGAQAGRGQIHPGVCRSHHRHPRPGSEQAARLFAGAERGSILYCMGITQHTTGTDNVKSLANLAMLCGHIGKPGTGVNPLRGQNNVQGACDMGGLPDVFSGYQKVTDEAARNRMAAAWKVDSLPAFAGLKVTQMLPAAHDGTLKAMYIIGENPLVSDADLNHAEKSLARLEFLVVQDIFLTETARKADVVLPSACYAEKEGTFSNTERRVQRVRKAVEPPGDSRNDWETICAIATRMGYPMSYGSARDIMEEIRRVTPSYAGISYERIEHEGIHWPCPNEQHPGTPILHREQFTSGKGVFHAIDFVPPAERADGDFPLYLTTGRLLYQYHTGTMTMKSAGLNDLAPDCFVEISSADAGKYDVLDGARVNIASRRGTIQARVKVSPKAVTGTVFIPFHYARAAANRLTNAALDPISGIPEFKVCAVKLEKAA